MPNVCFNCQVEWGVVPNYITLSLAFSVLVFLGVILQFVVVAAVVEGFLVWWCGFVEDFFA